MLVRHFMHHLKVITFSVLLIVIIMSILSDTSWNNYQFSPGRRAASRLIQEVLIHESDRRVSAISVGTTCIIVLVTFTLGIVALDAPAILSQLRFIVNLR